MEYCQDCHGCFTALPVLDPVDVEKAYHYSAFCHQCLQLHVRSYGWHDASISQGEDLMVGRRILRREFCAVEAVRILY